MRRMQAFATYAADGMDQARSALRWLTQWPLYVVLAPFALIGWIVSKAKEPAR